MNNAIKIFVPAIVSFITGILLAPIASHYFYKYKLWKKKSRDTSVPKNGFENFHDAKSELSTPRVGGIIVWLSVVITFCLIALADFIFDNAITNKLSFLSRNQTVLPLATLIVASLIGLFDDFLQIFDFGFWSRDPIVLRYIKIGIILTLGAVIGWWFFAKLGISMIYIPWFGFISIGNLFIPFFIFVMLAVWSSSVIDGVDGLSGGVLSSIFASYALIAFFQDQINLATFCAVISGAILAFLWFNIPPARFYMGETGMIGLTTTLSTIAFLTDTVLLLPIIAFPLFVTSVSSIIQMTSRKFRNGKKVFLFAPLHHHFEAIGWSKAKITMRYWIIGLISSIGGVVLALIS